MRHSQYTPSVAYINVSQSLLEGTTEQDKALQQTIFTGLQDAGFICLVSRDVIAAAGVVMDKKCMVMPFADKDAATAPKPEKMRINAAREEFVDKIFGSLVLNIRDSSLRFLLDDVDITSQVYVVPAQDAAHRQVWQKGANKVIGAFLQSASSDKPVAYIATDPLRLTNDLMNPVIGILPATDENQDGKELRLRKKTDAIVRVSVGQSCADGIRTVIQKFADLRERRAKLQESIHGNGMKLEPQFVREEWPGHPLVSKLLKTEVRQAVHNIISDRRSICDPLDLEYQALFRLTSLPVSEVFENGDDLQEYLQSKGAYTYWRNILCLEPEKIASYKPKASVITTIVDEQYHIVHERLEHSDLPIDDLTQRRGIFSESGWKLRKYKGGIAAIKMDGDTVIDKKAVTFKPVDCSYAHKLHETLHYIHTPRVKKAFGLYLEGEPLPFSVVAFDAIDRPYKKDLLLMLGYDPDYCLDLARLYSKPGTPFNTSSTIFTLAFAYFREAEPEVQAVLSAFMPTYAHGMSMISAGFNYGSLVKEWRHAFAEREINGKKVWELVTKRRKEHENGTVIESVWPLLPVFELFVPIRPPRFQPFEELDGMMVSKDL